jgi:hypothetical protein
VVYEMSKGILEASLDNSCFCFMTQQMRTTVRGRKKTFAISGMPGREMIPRKWMSHAYNESLMFFDSELNILDLYSEVV